MAEEARVRLEAAKALVDSLRKQLWSAEAMVRRLEDEIAASCSVLGYAVIYSLEYEDGASIWVKDEVMAVTAEAQSYRSSFLKVVDGCLVLRSPSFMEGLNQMYDTRTAGLGETAFDHDAELGIRFVQTKEEAEAQPQRLAEDE